METGCGDWEYGLWGFPMASIVPVDVLSLVGISEVHTA